MLKVNPRSLTMFESFFVIFAIDCKRKGTAGRREEKKARGRRKGKSTFGSREAGSNGRGRKAKRN